MSRVTVRTLAEMKAESSPITVLTAFDYALAGILDQAGVDVILVGDSLGMVALGYQNTLPVTVEEMLHHTRAVVRGVERALVVADLPFMSYQASADEAVRNAGRFLKDGGAQAVKIEGGGPMVPLVRRLVEVGIPVMGHLGLTPQFVHQLGGYRVQGRGEEAAERMRKEAIALEEAGMFALVLECVPSTLAAGISRELTVPTIGIGAGPDCDGQVLVTSDLLGLYQPLTPKFAKRYADLGAQARTAVDRYLAEVRQREFPGAEHTFD